MKRAFSVREILFATDYSAVSGTAGSMAANLARCFGARLHVIHAVPPLTDPGPVSALPQAIAELGQGLQVVSALVMGTPAGAIVNYARRHAIGLIVIGTHGRTGVSRVLLGSVAEAVVRRAGCPVMTVPVGAFGEGVEGAFGAIDDPCVICGGESVDLICEPCRTLIRHDAGAPDRHPLPR